MKIAALRRDTSKDFPLRGSVLCDSCGRPLTGCWSKGQKKIYPYYLCQKRGCENKGKSILKQVMEDQFVELLEKLEQSEELLTAAEAMFRDIWEAKRKSIKADQSVYQRQINQVEKKIDGFIEMVANTTNPTAAGLYEKRSRSCCAQRQYWLKNLPIWVNLSQPLRMCSNHQSNFSEPLKNMEKFRLHLEASGSSTGMFRASPKLQKGGVSNTKNSLTFQGVGRRRQQKSEMVPPHGLSFDLCSRCRRHFSW